MPNDNVSHAGVGVRRATALLAGLILSTPNYRPRVEMLWGRAVAWHGRCATRRAAPGHPPGMRSLRLSFPCPKARRYSPSSTPGGLLSAPAPGGMFGAAPYPGELPPPPSAKLRLGMGGTTGCPGGLPRPRGPCLLSPGGGGSP